MTRSLIRPLLAAAILAAFAVTPAVAQTLLDRAHEAVQDAGEKIEDAARDAGRDASDFLADNPDLNRDILDLGQRMGLPGFEDAKPYAGPSLAAAPAEAAPGASVMLTAAGLPGKAQVKLGFGPPGGVTTVLATADTSERGTLEQPVTVPDHARPGDEAVFTAETADGRVRLISGPVTIIDPGPPPGTKVDLTGTLSNEGVECPAVRGDDGKLYTLADPAAGGFRPGDRVRVEGEVAGMSRCMQGITLTATTITPADG
jgi:hypothetical protein